MKKTAKTAAIALALTAAASGLTACTPPWEAAYGVYGPDPNSTLTTVSGASPETAYSQTESVPDKAAKDGTSSSEKDSSESEESKADDKSKSSGKDSSKSDESKADKSKFSGKDSSKSDESKADKSKSSGKDSSKSDESKADKSKSSEKDSSKSDESKAGDSSSSSGTEATSSAEDKPVDIAEPDEGRTDGFEVDTAADDDGDTFADEGGIEEFDEYEITTETEDTE